MRRGVQEREDSFLVYGEIPWEIFLYTLARIDFVQGAKGSTVRILGSGGLRVTPKVLLHKIPREHQTAFPHCSAWLSHLTSYVSPLSSLSCLKIQPPKSRDVGQE